LVEVLQSLPLGFEHVVFLQSSEPLNDMLGGTLVVVSGFVISLLQ
jgi:hypothetical protein